MESDREIVKTLFDALASIAYMPWGYCVCPPRMGYMEGRPDHAHCGECREARVALAKAKEYLDAA